MCLRLWAGDDMHEVKFGNLFLRMEEEKRLQATCIYALHDSERRHD